MYGLPASSAVVLRPFGVMRTSNPYRVVAGPRPCTGSLSGHTPAPVRTAVTLLPAAIFRNCPRVSSGILPGHPRWHHAVPPWGHPPGRRTPTLARRRRLSAHSGTTWGLATRRLPPLRVGVGVAAAVRGRRPGPVPSRAGAAVQGRCRPGPGPSGAGAGAVRGRGRCRPGPGPPSRAGAVQGRGRPPGPGLRAAGRGNRCFSRGRSGTPPTSWAWRTWGSRSGARSRVLLARSRRRSRSA